MIEVREPVNGWIVQLEFDEFSRMFCENEVTEWLKGERVGTIKPVVGFPNIPGPATRRNRNFYTSSVPGMEVQGERYAGSVLEVETKKQPCAHAMRPLREL